MDDPKNRIMPMATANVLNMCETNFKENMFGKTTRKVDTPFQKD